jgi:hypothetical protein
MKINVAKMLPEEPLRNILPYIKRGFPLLESLTLPRSRQGLAASRQSLHGHSSNVRVFNKKRPLASRLANEHFIISIVRLTQSQRDHSIILATRPEPTVRPPSRSLDSRL